MEIKIGTRGSKLALAQAEYVKGRLESAYPELSCEICVIRTTGDKIQDRPLHEIGGKGLFIQEIEEKLLAGEIQLAVHSMKDMPEPASGLVFSRTWEREDNRDVLILREKDSLSELPEGAVIGTGSIRRSAQLKRIRQDLKFTGIRGNVDTRLRKMEEEKMDGIVLAAAGLRRLGLENRITQYLAVEDVVPAPAQGVLALELSEENAGLREKVDALWEEESHTTALLERAFMYAVGGGCHAPVGACCQKLPGETYRFLTMSGTETGDKLVFSDVTGKDTEKILEQSIRNIKEQMKNEAQ